MNVLRMAPALAVLLLVPVWTGLASSGGADPGLEWLGHPEGADEGLHMRVPVTVRNPHSYPMTNGIVAAEVDITEALMAAGWPATKSGQDDVLRSFRLDPSSVRVVQMVDLEPQRDFTNQGKMLAHDILLPPDDERRFTVPSYHVEGALTGSADFDPATRPTITVLWRVAGEVEPGAERFYVVYFDSLTNGQKDAQDPGDLRGGPLLESMFWSGPVVDAVGLVRPGSLALGTVHVIGLHDDTTVTVETANLNGVFQPAQPPPGFPSNPVTLDEGAHDEVFVSGAGQAREFRLQADKPVLALVDSTGFVPSITDGSFVGREFVFYKGYPRLWEQDTVYIINAGGAPTTVELESLEDGTLYTYHVNHSAEGNPFRFTTGPRAAGFSDTLGNPACHPTSTDNRLPPERGLYRARVTAGGPVLLQLQPSGGLTQTPTLDGAPAGTRFHATRTWSDQFYYDPPPRPNGDDPPPYCASATRVGKTVAIAWDGPSSIVGSNLLAENGELSNRPNRYDVPGMQETWLFMGPAVRNVIDRGEGFPHGVPQRGAEFLQGPLGGGGGTQIVGHGPTLVYAPFDGTVLEASIRYSRSGTVESEVSLPGAGALHHFRDLSSDDRIQEVRLMASRPVAAQAAGGASTFLTGVPPMLDATVHAGDYRGHVLDIRSPTGQNPMTGSTFPEEAVTYELVVSNHGRTLGGGDLPDTVRLELASVSTGWTAQLDRSSVRLHSGETATVHVTVTPEAGLGAGSLGVATVRAQSFGNADVHASMSLVTFLKRSFDVGLWFDQVDTGAKSKIVVNGTGGEFVYDMFVRNLGTDQDTVRIDLVNSEPGWDPIVIDDDGVAVQSVVLGPDTWQHLELIVKGPPDVKDGGLTTIVSATSASNPSVLDRVTARSKIQAPSNLTLSAATHTLRAEPGEELRFPVEVGNTGIGSATADFTLQVDRGSPWGPPDLIRLDPATGQEIPVRSLSLGPGEAIDLFVTLQADPDASAGNPVTARLGLSAAGGSDGLEAFLHGLVRPVHNLTTDAVPSPLVAAPTGVATNVTVNVTNHGNLNENLTVRPRAVPPGWSLRLPGAVDVARNASTAFTASVLVPPATPYGRHTIAVDLVAADGNRTSIKVPVVVARQPPSPTTDDGRILARPGTPASTTVNVTNDGNLPATVALEEEPQETWRLQAGPEAVLPPGASTTLTVAWQVPADAPDGASVHRAVIRLQPNDPSVHPTTSHVSRTITVGRPDLQASNLTAVDGPAGTVVRFTVTNAGDRDASEVVVRLVAADDAVDETTIAFLAAGGNRTVSLLAPTAAGDALRVVLDPDNLVVEADEANNVHTTRSPHQAPALSLLVIVVGLAATAALRRRH